MIIENKTKAIVYGPPSATMVKPFRFKPGKCEVDSDYWVFLTKHRNFKRDALDTKMLAEVVSDEDFAKQVRNLKNLSGFDLDGARLAISLVDDPRLLDKWSKEENRPEIGRLLLEKLDSLE